MTAPLSSSQQLMRRLPRSPIDRPALRREIDRGLRGAVRLNPARTHGLTFIAGRAEKGARVGAIAMRLGVTQPAATDSIASRVRKGFLTKASDPEGARAVTVGVTRVGDDIARGKGLVITATERALETLDIREQTELSRLVIKTIRALQAAGAIAPRRMCVTRRYFRPNANAYQDDRAPRHCAHVEAAFGAEGLRTDCDEREATPEAKREPDWTNCMKAYSDVAEVARVMTR
jgi:DNA-binding MarR family transcriptional regulator